MTHDSFSAGAALGDWSGDKTGKLTAVSENLEQGLLIVLSGPPPAEGSTYPIAEGGDSIVEYGDSAHSPLRVWDSVSGTVTVDGITASTSDRSKTLHLRFANVTAKPALDKPENTATGTLLLEGSALVEGVYLP